MSKIEELIEKLCPNGVEYKKTKEIKKDSFWLMPATPYYISEGVPYITAKNIKDGKINFENVNYISQEDYINISAKRKIEKNDLLVTMIGTIGETAFVEDNTEFYGQNMYLIRLDYTKINRKFYNYYLTSPKVRNLLVTKKNISNQGYIKAGNLEELSIPVPPLEIQNEIVYILDKFTALLAELKAELKARKKQYAYYLEKLIDIDNENLEKISIGELFKFKNGINKSKEFFGTGTPIINYIDVYKNNQLYANTIKGKVESSQSDLERYDCKRGDVFFTRTSETKEEVGIASVLLEDIKDSVFSGFLLRARPITNKLLPEYCAYCLISPQIRNQIVRASNITTRATTTGTILSKIKIPIPAIEVQEKVANILDRFNKLCNSLTEGIPAEIEARQKQYEYYRDKVLTFKELVIDE